MTNKFFDYQELQMQLFEFLKPRNIDGKVTYPRYTKSELKKILNRYYKTKYSTPTTKCPTLQDSQINRIFNSLSRLEAINKNEDETYSVSETWLPPLPDPKTKEEYISDIKLILYRLDLQILNRMLSSLVNHPLDDDDKDDYEFLLYALKTTIQAANASGNSTIIISKVTNYLVNKAMTHNRHYSNKSSKRV